MVYATNNGDGKSLHQGVGCCFCYPLESQYSGCGGGWAHDDLQDHTGHQARVFLRPLAPLPLSHHYLLSVPESTEDMSHEVELFGEARDTSLWPGTWIGSS
jgi:hypothetical protein